MDMKQKVSFLLSALMCMLGTSAWALEQDADGIYQIGTAEDLVAFSELVNGGETSANAVLTADIDLSAIEAFPPIGTYSDNGIDLAYRGTFDGKGHIVKNLKVNVDDTQEAGLFSRLFSAVVRNLGIVNASVTNAANVRAGVFAGEIHVSNVFNCFTAGDLTVETIHPQKCGFAGEAAGSNLYNCYTTHDIFSNDGNKVNCYWGEEASGKAATGELCYLLNDKQSETVWYQTLGEDQYPVLDATRGVVYTTAEMRCDGQLLGEGTYTNDASQASTRPGHKYENGICTVCGQKDADYTLPRDEEGFCLIENAAQLVWFADLVNGGEGSASARLTADIDMAGYNEFFHPIGTESSLYSGTFDGQGHRIRNLNISIAGDCVGVFGMIQSPAVIKNLILDESCTIDGGGHYCAIIGQARGANGPVYLENLGMEGTIHLTGWNGAGIIGNNYYNAVNIRMKNCYVAGTVTADSGYSGALTGWAGEGAVFENCWVVGEVQGVDGPDSYLVRGMGSGTVTNCYSKYGTQVRNITDEQVENGELCYLLNGESFVNPSWYQTLGEDLHPVFDATHGLVYKAGEEYGDVHDEASFDEFKSVFLASEKEYCETVIAEQALIDQYMESIETTEGCQTMEAFAKAYDEIKSTKALVISSAQAYTALKAKGDEVMAYMEEHDDFEGEKRNQLEEYLKGYVEPCEQFPNGSLTFIMETHTMNEAGAKGEIARIDQMLKEAIASGSKPHSDITSLLVNADFGSGWNGWEGTPGSGISSPAAECRNSTCDFHQTLTGLRNGIYELQVNGFFRPGNPTNGAGNPTSTNYGAFLYLNDMQNYLMAAIEDMIGANEAVDGENCFVTEGAAETDYPICDENDAVLGYVPGGQDGLKIAARAGRYQNRILVSVTDGTLTVGFRQPGTGIANDCMDIANLKLFYHGTLEDASAELDEALACMSARAQTLYDYEASYGMDYAQYPNYSAELRGALKTAIDAVGTTTGVEGKYALMGTFSDLFQQVYENKKFYVSLMDQAEALVTLSDALASTLTEEEVEEINNAVASVYEVYIAGTATESMMDEIAGRFSFLPKQKNGIYHLANGKDLQMFSLIVNYGRPGASAVMTNDIDMADFSKDFQPIGTESSLYSGTFDGQGHRIRNLNISIAGDCVGVFGMIQSPAVIKNLILDESCTIDGGGHYCAIIGQARGANGPVYLENLGMEGTIHLTGWNGAGIIGNNYYNAVNIRMKNCYVAGTVTADGGYSGALTGWAGEGAVFENCWVIGEVQGVDGPDSYLVRGMLSGTITNCYSKYGTQANPLTDEQVSNGELCYLLNGDQSEIVWYQTLGEDLHPVFDATHKTVVKNEDGSYDNITDIKEIHSPESTAPREIYDLSGRKVGGIKLNKGVYIMNGKKVMVR